MKNLRKRFTVQTLKIRKKEHYILKKRSIIQILEMRKIETLHYTNTIHYTNTEDEERKKKFTKMINKKEIIQKRFIILTQEIKKKIYTERCIIRTLKIKKEKRNIIRKRKEEK